MLDMYFFRMYHPSKYTFPPMFFEHPSYLKCSKFVFCLIFLYLATQKMALMGELFTYCIIATIPSIALTRPAFKSLISFFQAVDELQSFSHTKESLIALRIKMVESICILQLQSPGTRSFKGVQWILVALLCTYVWNFGPLSGYHCMVTERKQFQVSNMVKSGINVEYSAAKAIACNEHILRMSMLFGLESNDLFDSNQLECHLPHDIQFTGLGDKITKSAMDPSILLCIRNWFCDELTRECKLELSSNPVDYFASSDFFSYEKIRVGNCIFGNKMY